MAEAPHRIAAAFDAQSRACQKMGSPFMAKLMKQVLAAMPAGALRDRIFSWPGEIGPEAASVPLRLAAGLHALVLTGQIPPLYRGGDEAGLSDFTGPMQHAMAIHGEFLMTWLDQAPPNQ